jgi:hypothetical protein
MRPPVLKNIVPTVTDMTLTGHTRCVSLRIFVNSRTKLNESLCEPIENAYRCAAQCQ